MKIECNNNVFTITAIDGFDARTTFLCGQCFRWSEKENGSFEGVIRHSIVNVVQEEDKLIISGLPTTEIDYFVNYLGFNDDYAKIVPCLSRNPVLRRCIESAPGIRVLHQDFFETLITFIISQNNNIPRIKGIVDRLCKICGEEISAGIFSFPTAEAVNAKTEDDLKDLRAGWRAGYILDAARLVASGEVSEDILDTLITDDAQKLLMKIHGVGPKVADCTLLFGLGRVEAFPTDVWIKRAMASLFPDGLPDYTKKYAGIAQQFIFDYARNNADKL